jgi:hypothetical protein
LRLGGQVVDAVLHDGGEQVLLGREVPEHRALADARAPGDVGDRRVQAVPGELRRGGGQQLRAVAGGVGAQRAGGGHEGDSNKLTGRSVYA